MEDMLSILSVEPERQLNLFILEKIFCEDNGKPKFSAAVGIEEGPLKGKEFALEATGEPALLLNNLLDIFMNCGLQNESFRRLSDDFNEGSTVTLNEGDFILLYGRVYPLVRTVISSVGMLKDLKSVKNFQAMNSSSRFAVVARIETIRSHHFYSGCRTPRCFFKSLRDDMGTTVLDCPKCDERTEDPLLSTVFNVLIENGNAKEQIALFTNDVKQIAGEKAVDAVEKLVYMNKEELRNRFEKTFVFVVRPDIYGGAAEWKNTLLFRID